MNEGRSPLFIINGGCQAIAQQVTQGIQAEGLRTMRSFDLEAVRSSKKGYRCPVHGVGPCNCQMVVLLLFGKERYIVLTLEGGDDQTRIYLDSTTDRQDEQIDPQLTGAILRALFPKGPCH